MCLCVFVLEFLWHPQGCSLAGKCNVNLLPFNLASRKDPSVRKKGALFSYDYLYSLGLPAPLDASPFYRRALVLLGLDKHLQGARRRIALILHWSPKKGLDGDVLHGKPPDFACYRMHSFALIHLHLTPFILYVGGSLEASHPSTGQTRASLASTTLPFHTFRLSPGSSGYFTEEVGFQGQEEEAGLSNGIAVHSY